MQWSTKWTDLNPWSKRWSNWTVPVPSLIFLKAMVIKLRKARKSASRSLKRSIRWWVMSSDSSSKSSKKSRCRWECFNSFNRRKRTVLRIKTTWISSHLNLNPIKRLHSKSMRSRMSWTISTEPIYLSKQRLPANLAHLSKCKEAFPRPISSLPGSRWRMARS